MDTLDRRRFLGTAAALGMAGATMARSSPAAPVEEGKPSRRKFTMALSCGSIGVSADPRGAIRLAYEQGFEAVEPSVDFLARLSEADLQELLEDLKAKKLVWGAAGLSVDFRGNDSAFRDGLRRLPELAKGLQRAGVTRVGTWIAPSHGGLTYLANLRLHARRLGETAKVLGDFGQRLGLEYVGTRHAWTGGRFPFLHTMAEMKDLLAEIGRENVGLVLDSWHWHNAQESQSDLLSLSKDDVVACDLNDAPRGVPMEQLQDGRRELPCATGVIDLKGFLGGLAKIGYDGPIRAEPFNRALNAMPPQQAVAATAAAMKKAFSLVEA